MPLLEIFDDRQRLDQHLPIGLERRHQALRVDLEKAGLPLIAAAQMDERALVIEPLQIERDAHAERGGGTKIAVELHGGAQSKPRGRRGKLLRGRRRGKAAAAMLPRIAASDGRSGESPHEPANGAGSFRSGILRWSRETRAA